MKTSLATTGDRALGDRDKMRAAIPEAKGALADWLAQRVTPEAAPKVRARLRYGSFVSPELGYFYMETPKAGCSTVKALLATLAGKPVPPQPVPGEATLDMSVHNRGLHPVRNIFAVDPALAVQILEGRSLPRFCVVRNPYSRLYSGWADKIRQREPKYGRIANGLTSPGEAYPTFPRFVDYISRRREALDIHWRPLHEVLLADLIEYDCVIKVEELQAEITEFFAPRVPHANVEEILAASRANASLPSDWRAGYDENTAAVVQRLYYADFDRFDYDRGSWREKTPRKAAASPSFESAAIAAIRARNEMIAALHDQVRSLKAIAAKSGENNKTDKPGERDKPAATEPLSAPPAVTGAGVRGDLVERMAAFRLGRWAEGGRPAELAEVLDFIAGDDTTDTVAVYDARARRLLPAHDFDSRVVDHDGRWRLGAWRRESDLRVANACDLIDSLALAGTFVMNFTDAARWRFNERPDQTRYPIAQFARHCEDRDAVLFPLDYKYMGVGGPNLPRTVAAHDRPFSEKRDAVVWRGRLSGTQRRNGRLVHAQKLWNNLADGTTESEVATLIAGAHCYPRIRLCDLYADAPDIDVGLVPPDGVDAARWRSLDRLTAPRLSMAEQLGYRYVLCMPGNDYASGLYWALASQSVVLMPNPEWRTLLDFELSAWTHFVPLAEDLSDLRQRLEWCRRNQTAAQEISARARSYIAMLCDVPAREAADLLVTQRLAQIVGGRYGGRTLSFVTDRSLSKRR